MEDVEVKKQYLMLLVGENHQGLLLEMELMWEKRLLCQHLWLPLFVESNILHNGSVPLMDQCTMHLLHVVPMYL